MVKALEIEGKNVKAMVEALGQENALLTTMTLSLKTQTKSLDSLNTLIGNLDMGMVALVEAIYNQTSIYLSQQDAYKTQAGQVSALVKKMIETGDPNVKVRGPPTIGANEFREFSAIFSNNIKKLKDFQDARGNVPDPNAPTAQGLLTQILKNAFNMGQVAYPKPMQVGPREYKGQVGGFKHMVETEIFGPFAHQLNQLVHGPLKSLGNKILDITARPIKKKIEAGREYAATHTKGATIGKGIWEFGKSFTGIKAIGKSMKFVGKIGKSAGKALGGAFKGAAGMAGPMMAASIAAEPLMAFLNGFLAPLSILSDVMGGMGARLSVILVPLVLKLVEILFALMPLIEILMVALMPIIDVLIMLIDPLIAILEWLMPLFDLLVPLGQYIAALIEPLALLMNLMTGQISFQEFWDGLIENFKTVARSIAGMFIEVIEWLFGKDGQIADAIGGFFENIIEKFTGWLDRDWDDRKVSEWGIFERWDND